MRRGEKGDVAVEACSKEEKDDSAAVVRIGGWAI